MIYKKCVLNLSERMKVIDKNNDYLMLKAKFGPSKTYKVPLKLNEDLACLVGIIIGDRHLKRLKFQTTVEISNKNLLENIRNLGLNLFGIKTKIKKVKKRGGRKQTYYLTFYSKLVHELMNKIFEIPKGKKSKIVKIPKLINLSKKELSVLF